MEPNHHLSLNAILQRENGSTVYAVEEYKNGARE
jgi:hypothetical protein